MDEQNINKKQFFNSTIPERLSNGFRLLEKKEQPCFTSACFETSSFLKRSISGRISRLDNIGLGIVTTTTSSYPFKFDKIEGYSGQEVKALSIREGDIVNIKIKDEKILKVYLPKK